MMQLVKILLLLSILLALVSCSQRSHTDSNSLPVLPSDPQEQVTVPPEEDIERELESWNDEPEYLGVVLDEADRDASGDTTVNIVEDIANLWYRWDDGCTYDAGPPERLARDEAYLNFFIAVDSKQRPCNTNIDKVHLYAFDEDADVTEDYLDSWGAYSSSYSNAGPQIYNPKSVDIMHKPWAQGVSQEWFYVVVADWSPSDEAVFKIWAIDPDNNSSVADGVATALALDSNGSFVGSAFPDLVIDNDDMDTYADFLSLGGVSACWLSSTQFKVAACDPDRHAVYVWSEDFSSENEEMCLEDWGSDRPVDCCFAWDYTGCFLYVAVQDSDNRNNDYISVIKIEGPDYDEEDYSSPVTATVNGSAHLVPWIESVAVQDAMDHDNYRIHALSSMDTSDWYGFEVEQLDFPYGLNYWNSTLTWTMSADENLFLPEGLALGYAKESTETFNGNYIYVVDKDPDQTWTSNPGCSNTDGENVFVYQNSDV